MKLDVILTPKNLGTHDLRSRAVVVFDVLRATTTMTAALAAGVEAIHIFDSLEAARSAAARHPQALLCGERACLPPPGFNLGNSPGAFTQEKHAGRTLLMSTTNGTRAIVAARAAKVLLVGAVVNAAAAAGQLAGTGLDVTLLCAGTDGAPALEDLLGAGAVIDSLRKLEALELQSDIARLAERLFVACRDDLPGVMAQTTGGANVIAAGLAADVAYAARLDVLNIVGRIHDAPLRVVPSADKLLPPIRLYRC